MGRYTLLLCETNIFGLIYLSFAPYGSFANVEFSCKRSLKSVTTACTYSVRSSVIPLPKTKTCMDKIEISLTIMNQQKLIKLTLL